MISFIQAHHVLSLASTQKDRPSLCSVFYAFMPEDNCLIFASESKSEHIQNIIINSMVAASIHDEVRNIIQIKGLQIKGEVKRAKVHHEDLYTKTFPESKDLNKEVWTLNVSELKFTDNENIGFGKKEIWKY
ncbi:MAG TPA: hypothetical protein EYO73_01930 [Sulfurimonas sp.]|nr:hypothetical protein [Sulfurimonas sp.]